MVIISMLVSKENGKIKVTSTGKVRYINLALVGQISWDFDKRSGNYKVHVDVIGDGRCDTDDLKFYLNEVENQPTWINDVVGANTAVEDISNWCSQTTEGILTAIQTLTALFPTTLGQKNMANSFPVTIASNQNNGYNGFSHNYYTGSGTINFTFQSIAVQNVGNADGIFNGKTLKKGHGVSFEASAFRVYAANTVTYDATGTEFLIAWNV